MANKSTTNLEYLPKTVLGQPCVKSIINNNLNYNLKKEMFLFIKRNTLQDCGKVPPNCLKAHLIKTARKLKLPAKRLTYLKNLFRAKLGYMGYYLDSGKLKKI